MGTTRKRLYDTILAEHLASHRQMAFVTGPRQVGKTTTCREQADQYLNWDNTDDRKLIVQGPGKIAEQIGLARLGEKKQTVLFDELHKSHTWKTFLKGFFDSYSDRVRILVTGSSRMDVFRRGGDSMMGRYFLYRMHPFTVAEIIEQALPDPKKVIRRPQRVDENDWTALWEHGGYPEPFVQRDRRFSRRWQDLRMQQLVREDVRDLTQIQQLDRLELLVHVLRTRSGGQLIYSNLAGDLQVSVDTLRRWINTLCNLHLGFMLRPWFKNITRSLRKEPKWYLRDWSTIEDPGARAETFVACHLLKAVEGWNDLGHGSFQLGYLRDIYQREVDFIMIRDNKPWFIAEVKQASDKLSPSLQHFQDQLKVPYAFQVVLDSDYINADCFTGPGKPLIVPAKTFLSQLL